VVHAELWDGISVWNTEQQARKKAQAFPNLGSYIATLSVPLGGSIRIEKTLGPGHHTIWGDPAKLNACVQTVAPV
jgi:hypothetical protein